MSSRKYALIERRGKVAKVIINDPEKRNRRSREVIFGMSIIAGVLLVLTACASKPAPMSVGMAPALEAGLPEKPVAQDREVSKGDQPWSVEWGRLTMAAKKEGVLSVHNSSMSAEERVALGQILKDKFGIKAEFLTMSGGESTVKILRERLAGIYSVDVMVTGADSLVRVHKPRMTLESLHEALFLPEVVNKKLWKFYDGVFYDKEHMIVGGFATTYATMLVNKKLVQPGEIKGWKDLLDPKWEGKIALGTPTVMGVQFNAMVGALYFMGEDYIRKLIQQKPTLIDDKRVLVDWVVKGKFPVAVGVSSPVVSDFIHAGAGELVDSFIPVEGTHTGTGGHNMVLMNQAPHPNAAKLFLNWTQTREGQTLMGRLTSNASRRADVSNEWLSSSEIPQAGMKYIHWDEELVLKSPEYMKLFIEIFSALR